MDALPSLQLLLLLIDSLPVWLITKKYSINCMFSWLQIYGSQRRVFPAHIHCISSLAQRYWILSIGRLNLDMLGLVLTRSLVWGLHNLSPLCMYLFVLLCTSTTGNVESGRGGGGKINNKLIVNYLPQSMTDEAFTSLFAKCGQVCWCYTNPS